MIDNNHIVELLREVLDPESGRDIIFMKRVSHLRVQDQLVQFSLNDNGLKDNQKLQLISSCEEKIKAAYPEAQVHIHFDRSQGDDNNPLPHVKNVIAVASGKGGVGKSTVSVNLAIALKNQGARVGIIDADLYGPSVPTMLGLQGQRPKVRDLYGVPKIIPLEAYGLNAISIGNIVEPEQAVVLRGPRLSGIVRQFIKDCMWPELDFLIIDLPPGTGDIQLTLVQTIPLTGAIIVTTPQDLAVIDAVKAANMFRLPNVNVPIIGVIENMSWFTPEELPESRYNIFGEGGGQKLAKMIDSTLMGQLPLVMSIREGGDQGRPVATQKEHPAYPHFSNLALAAVKEVEIRNQKLPPSARVKITEG